jgi:toxin FitB
LKFTSGFFSNGTHAPQLETVAALRQGHIIDLTATLAIAAASLSHSERLPIADSIILATARAEDAII